MLVAESTGVRGLPTPKLSGVPGRGTFTVQLRHFPRNPRPLQFSGVHLSRQRKTGGHNLFRVRDLRSLRFVDRTWRE